MCLAIAYREDAAVQEKICENITRMEFREDIVVLTDILSRKYEILGKVKSVDLSEGTIIFV